MRKTASALPGGKQRGYNFRVSNSSRIYQLKDQENNMDAVNTFRVFDWLYSSGQISEKDIKQIQQEGFDTVINLALPTSTNALKGEAEWVSGCHMNYFQIPVEWDLPELSQFICFAALLSLLHAQKQKVWLHCAMNNRVSVFIYLYRKFILKESEEEARHPLVDVWTPNPLWQEFIREVSEYYANTGTL
jgi:protein tyrosine phosphatase (PTP) superfamily phosphohydrolase (DUF442 family)